MVMEWTQPDGYDALAAAIIRQACEDYMHYKLIVMRPRKRQSGADEELKKLRRFFYSRWCGILADIDPDELMSVLDRKIEEELNGDNND